MINLLDYEAASARHLSEMACAYDVAGAWDMRTGRENRMASSVNLV